jgi:hypothetical protein
LASLWVLGQQGLELGLEQRPLLELSQELPL